jgi:hypothetical protein
LARLLNYKKISVIEFGCAGGRGLLAAEMHINEITKIFDVSIELYGFDTGTGLPAPRDYRDLPYYYQPSSFKMDHNTLQPKLKAAKLVFGDVKETCHNFSKNTMPHRSAAYFTISISTRRRETH